ncbi:hypothetical protein [Kistimonas asteriae]|uniref:hypothetical protein n=1 Tax=Kistimonas asteriae TaxID=517724 RepID=UPI001BA85B6A|nr:hypothetical protein [Kistimonas asteriae]
MLHVLKGCLMEFSGVGMNQGAQVNYLDSDAVIRSAFRFRKVNTNSVLYVLNAQRTFGCTLPMLKRQVEVLRCKRIFSVSSNNTDSSVLAKEILTEHTGKIRRMIVVPGIEKNESPSLISCSDDCSLRVWVKTVKGWVCRNELRDHIDEVYGVEVLSPSVMVSCAQGGDVKVWERIFQEQWRCVKTISNAEGIVDHLTRLDSDSFSYACHNKIKFYKSFPVVGWRCVRELSHTDTVTGLVSLMGMFVFSSSVDQSIGVWGEIKKRWSPVQYLTGHTDSVESLEILKPYDNVLELVQCRLVSVSIDFTLRFWKFDCRMNRWFSSYSLTHNGVTQCKSLGMDRLVAASDENEICIIKKQYDASNHEKWEIVQVLDGHEALINSITIISSRCFITCSLDWSAVVWGRREPRFIGAANIGIKASDSVVPSTSDAEPIPQEKKDEWEKIAGLEKHVNEVIYGLKFSEMEFLSCGADKKIIEWDIFPSAPEYLEHKDALSIQEVASDITTSSDSTSSSTSYRFGQLFSDESTSSTDSQ